MNKKITSLSLAGIMLLSTASPVFAAPAEKTEVKQPTKAEEMVLLLKKLSLTEKML